MQAIFETEFDIVYLVLVITLGIRMIRGSAGRRQYLLFGIMAVTLGCGDAFHLIPRAVALCTTGLENYTAALGIGKLITSITMTIFYVLLYGVWRSRYEVTGRTGLTAAVWVLALVRIALCLMPQNAWTSAAAPLAWGIYRNIPFAILGGVMNGGFDQIWNLYNATVRSSSEIIDTYVYRKGIASGMYSLGTAVGLFKSAVGAALLICEMAAFYRASCPGL